jgi:hypothetical protein
MGKRRVVGSSTACRTKCRRRWTPPDWTRIKPLTAGCPWPLNLLPPTIRLLHQGFRRRMADRCARLHAGRHTVRGIWLRPTRARSSAPESPRALRSLPAFLSWQRSMAAPGSAHHAELSPAPADARRLVSKPLALAASYPICRFRHEARRSRVRLAFANQSSTTVFLPIHPGSPPPRWGVVFPVFLGEHTDGPSYRAFPVAARVRPGGPGPAPPCRAGLPFRFLRARRACRGHPRREPHRRRARAVCGHRPRQLAGGGHRDRGRPARPLAAIDPAPTWST